MKVTTCLAVLAALIQGPTAQESVRAEIHFGNGKAASSAAQNTAAALLHGLLNTATGGGTHKGGRHSTGVILQQSQASNSCRYWCKTPENQFYCCGLPTTTTTTTTFRPVRPGCCPKVRLHCPRIGRPVPCTHDHSCSNFNDKCCFDRCLEQHVCKPSEPCRGR